MKVFMIVFCFLCTVHLALSNEDDSSEESSDSSSEEGDVGSSSSPESDADLEELSPEKVNTTSVKNGKRVIEERKKANHLRIKAHNYLLYIKPPKAVTVQYLPQNYFKDLTRDDQENGYSDNYEQRSSNADFNHYISSTTDRPESNQNQRSLNKKHEHHDDHHSTTEFNLIRWLWNQRW